MKKKAFDCVQFKYDLQKKLYDESKATNFDEYFEFLQKKANTSSLIKKFKITTKL